MKNYFTFISLFIANILVAQNLGTQKLSSNYFNFSEILKLSYGGFLTAEGKQASVPILTKWDNQSNRVWTVNYYASNYKITKNIVEVNDGSIFFAPVTDLSWANRLHKISSNGTILWEELISHMNNNMNFEFKISSIEKSANDNGCILGGGNCGVEKSIIKLDVNGDVQWENQYKVAGGDPIMSGGSCFDILAESDGYVCSFFNSDSTFNFDSYLLKLDLNGNVIKKMAYKHSTSSYIGLNEIVKIPETNGYAILAQNNKFGDFKTGFSVIGTSLLILDSNLNVIDYTDIHRNYWDFMLNDITTLNNGKDIILTGTYNDSIHQKSVMISFSHTGNLNWSFTADDFINQNFKVPINASGLASDGQKVYALSGSGLHGLLLTIADKNGKGICTKNNINLQLHKPTINANSNFSLDIEPSFSIVTKGTLIHDNTYLEDKQVYCDFVPDTPEGLNEIDHDNSVIVYPQPCQHTLNMTIDQSIMTQPIEYTITSILGNTLLKGRVQETHNTISTDALTSGTYILRLITTKGILTKKIQIAK